MTALRMILIGGAALLWSLPDSAWAEDRPLTPISDAAQGIVVSVVEGRLVVRDAAPNPPVVHAQASGVRAELDASMPDHIQSLVHSISTSHGVDPRLVAAVMKVESNYKVRARSSKGALGLMQLIPETGRRFGVRDFFDPAQNIEGGVRYLKFLSDKFGANNLDLLLAAYNAGENLVARLGRVPAIPETVDYIRKIRRIYKPGRGPELVSAAGEKPTAAAPAPPAPPDVFYSRVDENGVAHFYGGPSR